MNKDITPYHNHVGDEKARNEHVKDCAWTTGILILIAISIFSFGCWLGYRSGYIQAIVEIKQKL